MISTWIGKMAVPLFAAMALAGDPPLSYWKQTTHEGGTRVPLIVAWPGKIAGEGGLRQDFVHVSDVAPTILEAVGAPLAAVVNNVRQEPMEGTSFAGTFQTAGDPRDDRAP